MRVQTYLHLWIGATRLFPILSTSSKIYLVSPGVRLHSSVSSTIRSKSRYSIRLKSTYNKKNKKKKLWKHSGAVCAVDVPNQRVFVLCCQNQTEICTKSLFPLRFVAGWQWRERFWGDLWLCGVLRDRLQTLVRKRRGKAALLLARSHLWSNRSELNLWGLPGEFQREKSFEWRRALSSLMLARWMKGGSIGYGPSHTPTLTEAFQVLIGIIV